MKEDVQDKTDHQRNPGTMRDLLQCRSPEQPCAVRIVHCTGNTIWTDVLTIKEAEDEEEAYCEEPRKLFDINNMNTDENSGAEHHCCDREARRYGTLSCLVERGVRYVPERVGQRNGTFEGSNDNNGKDHY